MSYNYNKVIRLVKNLFFYHRIPQFFTEELLRSLKTIYIPTTINVIGGGGYGSPPKKCFLNIV